MATVISNSEVTPGTHLLWLEAPQIAAAARPGQFVMVRCNDCSLLRRPLSVHMVAPQSSPARLALLFTVVGKGTQWLSQRLPKDQIDILGPLGNAFTIATPSNKLLMVAGGAGIAPLAFLAQQAVVQGHAATLLLGASSVSQLYPRHLLPPQVKLVIATEDGSAGRQGTVIDLVPDFLDQADQVFACGPVAMYHSLLHHCGSDIKEKPTQVSLEVRMGCGLGGCLGCTIKTRQGLRQVCRDGPVFELTDVIIEEVKV